MIMVSFYILGIIILLAAILAIYARNIVTAIISTGVISLLVSILFLLLAAPDVAMTEAAIGSGLTTMVFLYAYNRIRRIRERNDG